MSSAAPAPRENMGRPEPRLESRLKVTGQARYASDMAVNNPAFAYLVTSPIARGEITGIDAQEARAVPGLLDIFTHENTRDLKEVKYAPGGGGPTTPMQGFGPQIHHHG